MISHSEQLALGLAMLSLGLAAIGIREAIRQIIHRNAVKQRLAQIRRMHRSDRI